ncbi:MAG: hypothetical protein ACMXYB_04860 [Candidatus Woesearchaeota archaeon]
MIEKLEELIFGLNSYEKVKIEDRYLELYSYLQHPTSLDISSLQEYEILEKCLFKIKELLRIKSSNLNSIIKKKNKLTFEVISSIIQLLESKRKEVLQMAFSSSIFEKNTTWQTSSPFSNQEFDSQFIDYSIRSPLPKNSKTQLINDLKDNTHKDKIQEHTNDYTEDINNCKEDINSQCLTFEDTIIDFSKKGKVNLKIHSNFLDLIISKKLLHKIFRTQMYEGTMLYCKNSIHSQSNNQETYEHILLGLKNSQEIYNPILAPRDIKLEDINKTYEIIKSFNSTNNFIDNLINDKSNNQISNEISDEKNTLITQKIKNKTLPSKSKYISISHDISSIESHKDEEEDLEQLINSQKSTHTQHNLKSYEQSISKNKATDSQTPIEIEFEKNQETELENKLKNKPFENLNGIDLEIKEKGEKDSIKMYNDNIDNNSLSEDSYSNQKISKNTNLKPNQNIEFFEKNDEVLRVFEDEEIDVLIIENSKNLGTLNMSIKNENPSLHSYTHLFLFSKYFLQALFEVTHSQATMFVAFHNSTQSHLIPRFINDEVFEFKGLTVSHKELEDVQTQIYQTMANELKIMGQNNSQSSINTSSKNKEKEIANENVEDIITTTTQKPTQVRAKYLLSSLKRFA